MIGLIRSKLKRVLISKDERLSRRITPPSEMDMYNLTIWNKDVPMDAYRLVNVSIAGCCIEIIDSSFFSVGQTCKFILSIGDNTLKVDGVIRHITDKRIGIEFVLISNHETWKAVLLSHKQSNN